MNLLIIFNKISLLDPHWGKRLIVPILGCNLPGIGRIKTIMSSEKNTLGINKVVSFEEAVKEKGQKEPIFSQGLYHWVMFILSLYTRVRENLKIDFESFVILQVVVSHSLYQINKTGDKTYTQLESQIENILNTKTKKDAKLTLSSISAVLNMPRETVRRKIRILEKQKILEFNDKEGIIRSEHGDCVVNSLGFRSP